MSQIGCFTHRSCALAADILLWPKVAAAEVFWQSPREWLENGEAEYGPEERRSESPSGFEPEIDATQDISSVNGSNKAD